MAGNPNAKIRAANEGLTMRHSNGQLDWTGEVRYLPDRIEYPHRWRTPKLVFVNSLADMFYGVPDAAYRAAWATMAACPRHTFQILTKRPEAIAPTFARLGLPVLDNVWMGTSIEDQKAADTRIPHLLVAPAAIRFLSCEPLLGPLNLDRYLWRASRIDGDYGTEWDVRETADLGWVITGCESGARGRPCDLSWVRSLRDQCQYAGVPFHLKQLMVGGKKVELPLLDGERWAQMPERACA